jgi:hypothetical protein
VPYETSEPNVDTTEAIVKSKGKGDNRAQEKIRDTSDNEQQHDTSCEGSALQPENDTEMDVDKLNQVEMGIKVGEETQSKTNQKIKVEKTCEAQPERL